MTQQSTKHPVCQFTDLCVQLNWEKLHHNSLFNDPNHTADTTIDFIREKKLITFYYWLRHTQEFNVIEHPLQYWKNNKEEEPALW